MIEESDYEVSVGLGQLENTITDFEKDNWFWKGLQFRTKSWFSKRYESAIVNLWKYREIYWQVHIFKLP